MVFNPSEFEGPKFDCINNQLHENITILNNWYDKYNARNAR